MALKRVVEELRHLGPSLPALPLPFPCGVAVGAS